jgi:hypothetical protein
MTDMDMHALARLQPEVDEYMRYAGLARLGGSSLRGTRFVTGTIKSGLSRCWMRRRVARGG